MTKRPTDYIAQEGDMDIYDLDERVSRTSDDEATPAEAWYAAGKKMPSGEGNDCSSVMGKMSSLVSRLTV